MINNVELIKFYCRCGCGMSWKANKECKNQYVSMFHEAQNNDRLHEKSDFTDENHLKTKWRRLKRDREALI